MFICMKVCLLNLCMFLLRDSHTFLILKEVRFVENPRFLSSQFSYALKNNAPVFLNY